MMKCSIGELRESIAELRDNQSSMLEAFVVEYLGWKRETDQRFNILLEEVRALGKKLGS